MRELERDNSCLRRDLEGARLRTRRTEDKARNSLSSLRTALENLEQDERARCQRWRATTRVSAIEVVGTKLNPRETKRERDTKRERHTHRERERERDTHTERDRIRWADRFFRTQISQPEYLRNLVDASNESSRRNVCSSRDWTKYFTILGVTILYLK